MSTLQPIETNAAQQYRSAQPAVSQPAETAELRLRFLPASSRAEAMTMWRKLEIDISNQRLTCSSIWTETWLDHYGTLVPHQFAVGMRGATVCAIAVLTEGVQQKAGPLRLKTWHVGTAGEPDADSICIEYNSLLAGPQDQIEFADALWTWVRTETTCDEFRMEGFEVGAIQTLAARTPQAVVDRKSAYFFDLKWLRDNGEAPLMRLGGHTRSSIRRTLRDLGDIHLEWTDSVDQAVPLFLQMVRLHQARWNASGHPGVYASRRFHDFHLDLLCRTIPLGMATIFAVWSGDKLIGCNHVLIDGKRVLLYQSGRVSTTRRVSYGMVLDYLCICESLQRGYDSVEFLAGDGEHKRRLSTDRGEMAWVTWRRPNFKNRVIDTVRNAKQMVLRLGRGQSATSAATNAPAANLNAATEDEEDMG